MNIDQIPHGDMPGDKIAIEQHHIEKAQRIYPLLKQILRPQKTVVCVCGGSGVGKSEIASLLAGMLLEDEIKAYVMSGDNYPRRIPCENDAMREQAYHEGGEQALMRYLGSQEEIDFEEVESILEQFHTGTSNIRMKRMGRTPDALWYDDIDFSDTQVLILEWTHGNSDLLRSVDIPILLNSTPAETLEHRKKRNRDGNVDSPFTTLVLRLEQEQLKNQAHKARIIVSKSGEIISYEQYRSIMEVQ